MKNYITEQTTLSELQTRLAAFALAAVVDVYPDGGWRVSLFDSNQVYGEAAGRSLAEAFNSALNAYIVTKGGELFAPAQS